MEMKKRLTVQVGKGFVYADDNGGMDLSLSYTKHGKVPHLTPVIQMIGGIEIGIDGTKTVQVLDAAIRYVGNHQTVASYSLDKDAYYNLEMYRILKDFKVVKVFNDYDEALLEFARMVNFDFSNEAYKFNLEVFEGETV